MRRLARYYTTVLYMQVYVSKLEGSAVTPIGALKQTFLTKKAAAEAYAAAFPTRKPIGRSWTTPWEDYGPCKYSFSIGNAEDAGDIDGFDDPCFGEKGPGNVAETEEVVNSPVMPAMTTVEELFAYLHALRKDVDALKRESAKTSAGKM